MSEHHCPACQRPLATTADIDPDGSDSPRDDLCWSQVTPHNPTVCPVVGWPPDAVEMVRGLRARLDASARIAESNRLACREVEWLRAQVARLQREAIEARGGFFVTIGGDHG